MGEGCTFKLEDTMLDLNSRVKVWFHNGWHIGVIVGFKRRAIEVRLEVHGVQVVQRHQLEPLEEEEENLRFLDAPLAA